MLLALLSGSAATAQSVWTAGTGNWSDAGNWNPAVAPVSGASTVLEFGHAGANYVATNNIGAGFQLNSLIFSGSSSGTIGIAGSSINFVENGGVLPTIYFNASNSVSKTITAAMVLSADTTVTNSVGQSGNGNLQLGSMSGTGALILDFDYLSGGGVLLATGSTFSGGITMNKGRLFLGHASALGTGALTLAGGTVRTTFGATSLSYTNTLNFAGNTAIFESSTANPLTFTNGGAVQGTNATHTVTLGNANATLTLGGTFTGAGNGLNFAGSGIVNLGSGAADTAANTYSGTTTVSSSTVTLNLNKAAGTNALAGNLAVSNGTVGWARSNQIADTASVSQSGGTVALGQGLAETVASTTLTGGTFTVSKDANYSTGSLATTTSGTRFVGGTLEVGAGGLVINHDGTAATRNAFTLYESANTSSGVLLLNGDLTFNNDTAASTKVQVTRSAGTGYIDLGGGNRTFTIDDGGATDDLEITVRITNGGLIKEGAGVLAFLNTASDYTGDTVINAGTIRSNGAAQTLSTQSTYALADSAGVTLDLGGNNQTIGGLSGGGATGGTVTLGAGTLTAGGNNANTSFSGAITGTGGLTKTGSGSLTLGSNLAYTGATLVSNGTLVVNGDLASSGVTVDGAGAVLGGSGRVNSLTITQGTFGPGNSPGTFTVDGNVEFGSGATFSVEAASAASFDRLVVNGLGSTVTIDPAASLLLSGFDALPALSVGTEFIIIENNSSNSIVGSFADYAEGSSFTLGSNTFQTSYLLGTDSNDFGFIVTAVPEPSTFAALAGLAGLAVAAMRRRRPVARQAVKIQSKAE